MKGGEIVITDDLEGLVAGLQEEWPPHRLVLIQREELGIEDAKEAIAQAHIATEEPRLIALVAPKFTIYAQNALLKVLEEPPPGVSFLLAAKNASIFLATIRSRLPLRRIAPKEEGEPLRLDSFDLQHLYELSRSLKKGSKQEAKAVLQAMLRFALEEGYQLDERELDRFQRAFWLLELHANPAVVVTTIGLMLLKHKGSR
ncbi:MAG: hypothetical protein GXO38_05610 [Epsilonproteobacteria bacterium]|nr:hypothetical protein [Campylobacterota bacterium]